MAAISLGFNCNSLTNRVCEPEKWTCLCRDLSARQPMFSVGPIDPNFPWRLQRATRDRTLEACADTAIPMRLCLDVGHRYRGSAPEKADRLAWRWRYGSRCDSIECKQTNLEASHHGPFKPENNRKGIGQSEMVVKAHEVSVDSDVSLASRLRTPDYDSQRIASSRISRDLLPAGVAGLNHDFY